MTEPPARSAMFALVLLTSCVAPPARSPPAPAPAPVPTSAPPPAARETSSPQKIRHVDINHVLSTGQSLAVGVAGHPPLTTTQPFYNLMFSTGVMAGDEGLDAFVPLVEGDTIPGTKRETETMSSGFANLVSALAAPEGGHDLLMSVHGAGAWGYARLKRGTRPYARGMAQVAAARELARAQGKSYVVRAVTNVHGETDHMDKSPDYKKSLLEWQADYEHDIKELTGQLESVPMFHTQISNWPRLIGRTTTSPIPEAQLQATLESDGKLVLVGPKYHLPYSRDGIHLTNEGYRHMGEDYAKAYHRVIVEGRRWEPVRPTAITREGAVITVKLAVPAPPLVLDTTLVSDPGACGFEYTDSSSASPTITRVEVTSPDTVTITLSAVPTGDDKRLRYAFSAPSSAYAGPMTGPRGNLRDSDDTKSLHGYALYNWCVHFDEAVP